MPKGKVNFFICSDGILVHDKDENQIHTWYESLDSIKIMKSKRTVVEVLNSL